MDRNNNNIVIKTCLLLLITEIASANNEVSSSFQLLARTSFQNVDTKPYNMPNATVVDPTHNYAPEKYLRLKDFMCYSRKCLQESATRAQRIGVIKNMRDKLNIFIDHHIKDLKRLLFATDMALLSMIQLKVNKKMDASEAKIRMTQANIPFGLYTSPEYRCIGTSYYIVSAHNRDDAQMILSSERKPHCYNFRGMFSVIGYGHRPGQTSYVGPTADTYLANDPSQGLYCKIEEWRDSQCVFKINPLEVFPESVEYEPKISYYCGPYRYFIPATTDIRCIFSVFSMNFVLRFAYDGVTYAASDMTFTYQNGQSFYTDEPWAGMSCWSWVCKWRHNQNMFQNEFDPIS